MKRKLGLSERKGRTGRERGGRGSIMDRERKDGNEMKGR